MAIGRAKGFAHVELNNNDLVDSLVEKLNGYPSEFKPLFVERAGQRRSMTTSQTTSWTTSRVSSERKPRPTNVSVFLGNLGWGVTTELLEEMLTDVLGPKSFLSVRLARDRMNGNHRGFAHIDFPDQKSAESAVLELNGMELLNRILRADIAASRTRWRKVEAGTNTNTPSTTTSSETSVEASETTPSESISNQ